MLKRYMQPMLGLILGGVFLSLTPGYSNSNSNRSSSNYSQSVKPGVPNEDYESQQSRENASGREEIAYVDERDIDIHQRANRRGDWGYKQNWRYDRKAFYKGETQGEAYDRENPDGVGGPGMDPDNEYLQMHKFYLEQSKRQSAANQTNSTARPYANSQNESYRANYSDNREMSNQSSSYAQPHYPSTNGNYHQSYNNPNYNPNYNNHFNYDSNDNPNGYQHREYGYQNGYSYP